MDLDSVLHVLVAFAFILPITVIAGSFIIARAIDRHAQKDQSN